MLINFVFNLVSGFFVYLYCKCIFFCLENNNILGMDRKFKILKFISYVDYLWFWD